MSEKTYRDLLPVIVASVGASLPPGFDSWGLKSVHPDLQTTRGFKWPYPGGRARSDHALDEGNHDACPQRPGDGLCVVTTWAGMASGGIPARTLLLVAYRSENILGADRGGGKLRVRGEVAVVAVVDGWRLLREAGAGANLRRANLRGAALSGANLSCADLRGADLRGADLYGANLAGANLRGADLRGADLFDADLSGADLSGATLSDADLRGADLSGAVNVKLPYGWTLNKHSIAKHDPKDAR